MKSAKTLQALFLDFLNAWVFLACRSSKNDFLRMLYATILSKACWSHPAMMMPVLEIVHIDRSEKLLYLLYFGVGICLENQYSATEMLADAGTGTGLLKPGKGRNPVPILTCGTSKGYSKHLLCTWSRFLSLLLSHSSSSAGKLSLGSLIGNLFNSKNALIWGATQSYA